MGGRFSIIYGDEFLAYDFGEKHPLRQTRVRQAIELVRVAGVASAAGVSIGRPDQGTIDDLLLFHTPKYVEFVRFACLNGTGYLDRGDTPAAIGCFEAAQCVAGTSRQAAQAVWEGQIDHAFNLGGGLHHAHSDRASGFCVFNDIAVSIAYLLDRVGVNRVAYIDIDAHHGDGVMYGFYGDARVLHIDFHEDGHYLFPGTGHREELGRDDGLNLKINVPFPPHSTDRSFVEAFRQLVPALIRRFAPQIILMQTGVDAHAVDPLTHMDLSHHGFVEVMNIVHDLAHEVSAGKLVMFGGGGYSPDAVAVLWTMMAAAVAGVPVEEKLPPDWRFSLAEMNGVTAPGISDERASEDRARVQETVEWLREKLQL